MRRRSAALLLLAFVASAALASAGANASRTPVPEIVGVQAGAFSAVVKWQVPEPGRVVIELGPDERYGIWSPTTAVRQAQADKTTLAGLEPATTYRYRVLARWRNGMRAEARGSFRTDPWPHSVDASAAPTPADSSSTPDSPFVLPPKLPPGVTPTPPAPGALPPGTPRIESSAPLRVNGAAVFGRRARGTHPPGFAVLSSCCEAFWLS